MNLNLKRMIPRATLLLLNSKHTDFGYGALGKVHPGDIHLVSGIGPFRPERGSVWLKDDRQTYWEVSDDELKRGLEIEGGPQPDVDGAVNPTSAPR